MKPGRPFDRIFLSIIQLHVSEYDIHPRERYNSSENLPLPFDFRDDTFVIQLPEYLMDCIFMTHDEICFIYLSTIFVD